MVSFYINKVYVQSKCEIKWFDDKTTRWLCVLYTPIHTYIMILWWWDVMRTWWWLCSTTGSYGRLVIEVAYGETLIHSTKAVWKILARKEWLGCRHDTSPMFDISKSTLVWAQCIYIFFGFQTYKNLYVLCFQIYTYYKMTRVDSDLVLPRRDSEDVFDRPWVLKRETNPQMIL